jgi:hypothetical protein
LIQCNSGDFLVDMSGLEIAERVDIERGSSVDRSKRLVGVVEVSVAI